MCAKKWTAPWPGRKWHPMGRALAAILVVLVFPSGAEAGAPRRVSRPAVQPRTAARPPARPPARRPTLAEAKASMKALMRDKAKRRYRHNWERAIHRLELSSRGKDRPAGLLETARARYALYRWSANEADRDEALRLASAASRLGRGTPGPSPPPSAARRATTGPPAPRPGAARPARSRRVRTTRIPRPIPRSRRLSPTCPRSPTCRRCRSARRPRPVRRG